MLRSAVTRLLLAGMLICLPLLAQRDLGTITGTVLDAQGAAIPGATVTILEAATGLKYVVTTSQTGDYVRPALKPGTYTVTVEAQGFRRAEQQNVVVRGGDRVGVPFTLQVGDITQSVEVSAAAPLLQTESTVIGQNLGAKAVSDLPLSGQRFISFLAQLSPGVLPAENGARDALGGGFSANGVRSNGQNNFLLNGVDNNVNVIDFLNQTAFVVGPPPEAVGDITILTNGYNAEYGRGAGGVMNVNIKSGTNEIHGEIWEYLQNTDLNANAWEYNRAGAARGPFHQNQFGADVGLPIIKNKLFFFGDYQGTRIASVGGAVQNLGYGGYYTIPTPAMKQGDFSGVGVPIYDPNSTATGPNGQLTRTPFPGNIIPANRFDPAAAKIMALYPNPNQPYTTYGQNDYFVSTPGALNTDGGDMRMDYHMSDKNSLFGSMSWANTYKTNVPPFPGALNGGNFYGNTEEDLSRNAQMSFTRVWTPSIVSETRLGFTRLVTARAGADQNVNDYAKFGIGGYNPTAPNNGGLPQIDLGRYSQIGSNDWLPSLEYSNVWDFIQNVSITHGSHNFKFGFEARQIRFPFFQVPYPHGEIGFSQNETQFPSAAFNGITGNEMASFLLGAVNFGQISTDNFISSWRYGLAGYAQDDWKVTPKLTINLGMRYEVFSPISEAFGRQSNLVYQNLTLDIPRGPDQNAPLPPNFASAFPNVTVSRGQVSPFLIPFDLNDWGPRIGLAYRVREKTVVRVAYGIFYGGEENQGGYPNRGEAVPFNESPLLSRPPGITNFQTNPFFANGFSAGFPTNVFSLNAPVQFRSISTDFTASMVQKWNFAIQQELPWQSSIEAAYEGNHQSHSLLQPDFNACPNFPSLNPPSCNSLRLYPDIGGISGTASNGFGNYNAFTLNYIKHAGGGLNLTAAYTWSHTLANSGTTLSGSNGFGYLNPLNLATSYSNAAWDIPQALHAGFTWDIPFGKGKTWGSNLNKFADTLLGNWSMDGIWTLNSSIGPFTLRDNTCEGQWWTCLASVVPGKSSNAAPPNGRNPNEWFNTANIVHTAAMSYGNIGLQSMLGPPQRVMNLALTKTFDLTERFKLQFRGEAFNMANTPQYGYPDNNRQDSTFGQITSTLPGSYRVFQFSLHLLF
jgi:hypothetical protein